MLVFVFYEYNLLGEFYSGHLVDTPSSRAEYEEYVALIQKHNWNAFENRFDLLTCSYEVYMGDRKVLSKPECDLPKPVQVALVTLIYLDPALTVRGMLGYGGYNYMYYRFGVLFLESAANVIWIAASAWIGMACFNKREVR